MQLIENSVCLLRNLSYQVHREIPGCERFQEAAPLNQGPAPSGQKGGCFSSRKGKGLSEGERGCLLRRVVGTFAVMSLLTVAFC